MIQGRSLKNVSGLSPREFSALAGNIDADYAEGRVVVGEGGWIVSRTEMQLAHEPSPKPDRVVRTSRPEARSGRVRVLHFYKTYFPDSFGGAETVINEIARSTASLGIETEVLSLSRSPAENSTYVDGHWAKKARLDFQYASTGFSLSALWEFSQRVRDVDLVHYHFPWPLMDIAHFLARVRTPSVVRSEERRVGKEWRRR